MFRDSPTCTLPKSATCTSRSLEFLFQRATQNMLGIELPSTYKRSGKVDYLNRPANTLSRLRAMLRFASESVRIWPVAHRALIQTQR